MNTSNWRIERDKRLAEKAKVSAAKKEATVKAAQEWIDDFYKGYNENAAKQIAKTRKEEAEYLGKRENTAAGGTAWERVAKLVDLTGKGDKGGGAGSNKEEFRRLLLDLKNDTNAPGAKGT